MHKPIKVGVAFTNGWSLWNIVTVLGTLPGCAAHTAIVIAYDDGKAFYWEVRFKEDGLVGPLPLSKMKAWAHHNPLRMLEIIWLDELGEDAAKLAEDFCESQKHVIKGYAKTQLAARVAARLMGWKMPETTEVQDCSEFVARVLFAITLGKLDVRPKGRTFDYVSPNDVRNALKKREHSVPTTSG